MKKRILFSLFSLVLTSLAAQEKISETVTYHLPVKTIKLNSETIAYADEGSGEETLLFVHGLSSNLDSWKKNIAGLSSDYRCIAIDLPGYGKSSRSKTDYSLSEYAGILNEIVEKMDLKNVVLAGHSMGGQIAMHSVLKYPETYKKLVLIAPAGIETFTAQEATIMKASYTPAMLVGASDEQVLANYKMNFYSFPEDAQAMVDDRIAMKSAEDFQDYAETVVNNIHAMLEEPVIDEIGKIEIPVLMIFGKNDMLIPNKYFHPSESIASLVKTSEEKFNNIAVKTIDEAGHFVNFEQSEKVNKEIRDFLE
ncbi:pimeloyl-ACP methyl ester carboxylesterase [Christiangramia gaetbulicola]|uniref:Pimeloyl-ACP methyl ester carboxylesterase n=1 Tax=Christiangramia gaetbulicola TaxID=703340 RepID=A0A2T6AL24_9FLAO|nr:alpha/beta hydrolase [Christiangramia gaetbulicola]PTX44521.1 pimeloyl-ACP methyl ester carboxylesterase [Christiangramia gaetbulicola]